MDSNYTILIIIFVVLLLISAENSKKIAARKNRQLRTKMRGKGSFFKMSEMIKRYLGKDCIIYCGNSFSESVSGIIEEVTDEWVCVTSKEGNQIVKIEYISRIREYPKNKKGKRATVFS